MPLDDVILNKIWSFTTLDHSNNDKHIKWSRKHWVLAPKSVQIANGQHQISYSPHLTLAIIIIIFSFTFIHTSDLFYKLAKRD